MTENRQLPACLAARPQLHMVGEPQRGYLLELLCAKLIYASKRGAKVQIIGMSATLPNMDDVTKWHVLV